MEQCNYLVRSFLDLCSKIGVPIAEEKTEWAAPCMTFLGMQLDGNNFLLRVPADKKLKALNWINYLLDRKKATINDLEKLAGLLNFIRRAVVPGRAFTRCMYSKFSKIKEEKKLRPHHHLNLDSKFKSDCKVWKTFLSSEQLSKRIAHPFMDLWTECDSAETLMFYSDASANERLKQTV